MLLFNRKKPTWNTIFNYKKLPLIYRLLKCTKITLPVNFLLTNTTESAVSFPKVPNVEFHQNFHLKVSSAEAAETLNRIAINGVKKWTDMWKTTNLKNNRRSDILAYYHLKFNITFVICESGISTFITDLYWHLLIRLRIM